MPKKAAAENSKKAAGNAKKAAVKAEKDAAAAAVVAAKEDQEWAKGSKNNAKKEAEAAKKAEQAAKKKEREAELAKEEASIKTAKVNPKAPSKVAAAPKRDLSAALDSLDDDDKPLSALQASNIDDALDALSLTSNSVAAIDRHPERRFKAALAAYQERRLPELKEEQPGLRQNQMIQVIRKEFDKSPDNPFNQTGIVSYDASKEEVARVRREEKEKNERRLAGNK